VTAITEILSQNEAVLKLGALLWIGFEVRNLKSIVTNGLRGAVNDIQQRVSNLEGQEDVESNV
jgi:hypothetical protein